MLMAFPKCELKHTAYLQKGKRGLKILPSYQYRWWGTPQKHQEVQLSQRETRTKF